MCFNMSAVLPVQLQKTIEETKRGVEEKAAAMGAADADFAKAKARVEKVAEDLKALEQEQQVGTCLCPL